MVVISQLKRFALLKVLALSSFVIHSSGTEYTTTMNVSKDKNITNAENNDLLSRSRRYLLWNPLSVIQITIALSVPMKEVREKSKNVGVAFDIQGNYPLPTQVTQLEPGYIPVAPGSRRVTRDLSLQDTYRSFEEILYAQGLDGKSCLLQAICMTAEIPMARDDIFEEIVHLLLTPGEIEPEISGRYKDAQKLGDSGADCRNAFPNCRTPILDVISRIWHPSS